MAMFNRSIGGHGVYRAASFIPSWESLPRPLASALMQALIGLLNKRGKPMTTFPYLYNVPDCFSKLEDQTKKDLIDWLNHLEPTREEMWELARLYNEGKFSAWDCPECNDRVFFGTPDNWEDYQGVMQADYVSYPGNNKKYQEKYLQQLCDDCRNKM